MKILKKYAFAWELLFCNHANIKFISDYNQISIYFELMKYEFLTGAALNYNIIFDRCYTKYLI